MNSRALFFVSCLLSCTQAFAWGAKGHEIVTSVGSTITSPSGDGFWVANADGMKQLATVPDRVWKQPATKSGEEANHWFQADAYVPDLKQCNDILSFPKVYDEAVTKYGLPTITKNGTAPWRIVQLYQMAVSDFKKGDMKTALQEAGAMSHYIGDLSQPLHVSENYDGQQTGNTGIHAWFETANIPNETTTRAEVLKRAQALLADPSFVAESSGDLPDLIWHEVIRAVQKRDEILANDTKLGRTSPEAKQTQLSLAEDRMADGAAVLSIVLNRLWKDTGLTLNSSLVPITDPAWIKPDFSSSAAFASSSSASGQFSGQLSTPIKAIDNGLPEDDCLTE